MSTTLLSIKTDPETKQQLKAFASELGITSTAFVNMVVKQALRDRRVTLSTALEPTPYLEGLIKESEADYQKGDYVTLKSSKDIDNFFDNL